MQAQFEQCLSLASRLVSSYRLAAPAGCDPQACGGVDAPAPRDIAAETRETLQAQIDLAPDVFSMHAAYDPFYSALNMQSLEQSLIGNRAPRDLPTKDMATWSPPLNPEGIPEALKNSWNAVMKSQEGSRTAAAAAAATQPAAASQTGAAQPNTPASTIYAQPGGFVTATGDPPGDTGQGPIPPLDLTTIPPTGVQTQVNAQGGGIEESLPSGDFTWNYSAPGLLGLYEYAIAPTMRNVASADATAQRTSDVNDVFNLGGKSFEALRNYDPAQTGLVDALTSSAEKDLALGNALNSSQSRTVQQAVREGQASRGFGLGPNDMFEEVLASSEYGDALKREREANARNAIGMRASLYGDPFMQILGRPSGQAAAGTAILGQGGGVANAAGQQLQADPFNAYASDLFSTNYNGQAQALRDSAANSSALWGAGISAVGSLGGGLLGCWVAREVFGAENPQWKRFKVWLYRCAPAWFRWTYLRYGERFAAWVHDKPTLKRWIRRWMESRIKSPCTRAVFHDAATNE